ncbi:MAG: hypothetical protein OHK0052_27880 [Anaerolineales bacterium]
MKKFMFALLLLIALLSLTACGGSNANTPAADVKGNAENGKALFAQSVIGSAPGCATCHSLEADTVIVGPSMKGYASHAQMHADETGQSLEEYTRTSIVDPNAYVVEGFTAGLMYANFGTDLSSEQIDDLVAYLLTLK